MNPVALVKMRNGVSYLVYMYTLGAGRILIKSIIIVCYWHGRLAGLTEQVKMKKKEDNDKIKKKSRSKRRAPVIGHAGTHKSPHLAGDFSFLSRVIIKTCFCMCEIKGTDQLSDNRAAYLRACFRYIDTCSTIPLLHKFEISSL